MDQFDEMQDGEQFDQEGAGEEIDDGLESLISTIPPEIIEAVMSLSPMQRTILAVYVTTKALEEIEAAEAAAGVITYTNEQADQIVTSSEISEEMGAYLDHVFALRDAYFPEMKPLRLELEHLPPFGSDDATIVAYLQEIYSILSSEE